jgi:hypothetical protein
MKTVSAIVAVSMFLLVGCKKDMTPAGKASFNFRGDTTSVFRMATYDTCTLFSNANYFDSTFWDLGNGTVSKDKNLILSYTHSGTYDVKLTVRHNNGQETSVTKKVVVLDRVLKKIIIKRVFGIPSRITYLTLTRSGQLHQPQMFLCKHRNIHTEILSFLVAVFYLTRQYFTVARYSIMFHAILPFQWKLLCPARL